MPRLTRTEQTAQNRERLLGAAGELFRRKGFHGATLDAISEAAGFSTGVIYSQFGSKDDLALALMEQRSQRRIQRAMELAETTPSDEALRLIAEEHRAFQESDVDWTLLVLEFRIHAARNPDLNRRYSALHRRTLEGVARVFDVLRARIGSRTRFESADLARFVAALDSGNVLERVVDGPGDTMELTRHALSLALSGEQPTADP